MMPLQVLIILTIMKIMKTFKDLEFKTHPNAPYFSTQARMDFDNEYGISVVTGSGAYSSSDEPYEVGVLYKGSLTYNTDITDDVIGYQTADNVTEIMKQIQLLK